MKKKANPTRYGGAGLLIIYGAILLSAAIDAGAQTSFNELFPPSKTKKAETVERDPDALIREETKEEKLIDAFTIRQVKFESDWNPDPSALPSFFYQFRRNLRMRAVNQQEPLELADDEIFRWPLLYITAHNSFAFTTEERENLKKYLQRGGRIIADDCAVGQGGFMPAFISEMRSMFPSSEIIDLVPDHPRFGDLYKILYEFRSDPGIHSLPTQGMLVNGRLGIILEHDDIGCAWEVRSPPTSANPLGIPVHGQDTAGRAPYFEWGFNMMLYMMTK